MHKWHKPCYFRNKEVNNINLKCRLHRDVRIIQIYILSKESVDCQLLLKWLQLSCIPWPFWNEEVFKDSLTHTLTLSSGIYFTFPASVAGSRWGSWCSSWLCDLRLLMCTAYICFSWSAPWWGHLLSTMSKKSPWKYLRFGGTLLFHKTCETCPFVTCLCLEERRGHGLLSWSCGLSYHINGPWDSMQ